MVKCEVGNPFHHFTILHFSSSQIPFAMPYRAFATALGAQRMAGLAIDGIRTLRPELAAQLRRCPAKP
jgi:hypothetical protein